MAHVATAKKEKTNLKYQRDKDRQIVKGKFIFNEVPGGQLDFVYRKYPEDPVERYSFVDGEIYSIPLGVAKHINQNLSYPEHEYIKGEPGVIGAFNKDTGAIMRVKHQVRRATFQSLEFLDIEDLEPDNKIATVEKVI